MKIDNNDKLKIDALILKKSENLIIKSLNLND